MEKQFFYKCDDDDGCGAVQSSHVLDLNVCEYCGEGGLMRVSAPASFVRFSCDCIGLLLDKNQALALGIAADRHEAEAPFCFKISDCREEGTDPFRHSYGFEISPMYGKEYEPLEFDWLTLILAEMDRKLGDAERLHMIKIALKL